MKRANGYFSIYCWVSCPGLGQFISGLWVSSSEKWGPLIRWSHGPFQFRRSDVLGWIKTGNIWLKHNPPTSRRIFASFESLLQTSQANLNSVTTLDGLANLHPHIPFQFSKKSSHCMPPPLITIQSHTVLPDSIYTLVSKPLRRNRQLIWWRQRDQNNIPVIVTGGKWELSFFFFLTFQMTSNPVLRPGKSDLTN